MPNWDALAGGLSSILNNKFINDDTNNAIQLMSDVRNNLNSPVATDEQKQIALNQLKSKYGDLSLIGTNPLQGIEDQKKAYGSTTDPKQQEIAHKSAEMYRKIAAAKGIDLTGYGEIDPIKTFTNYTFGYKPLAQQSSPLLGGVSGDSPSDGVPTQAPDGYPAFTGTLSDMVAEGASKLNGQAQGAASAAPVAASQPNETLSQLIQKGAQQQAASAEPVGKSLLTKNGTFFPIGDGSITFDDLDKMSGGQYSQKLNELAAQMAKQRAADDLNSGTMGNRFYQTLLQSGYRPEAIARVLPMFDNMVKQMQSQNAQTTKQAAYNQFSSDMASANGDPLAERKAIVGLFSRLGDGDQIGKYAGDIIPKFTTHDTDYGNAIVTRVINEKTGKGTETPPIDKGFSPDKVLDSKTQLTTTSMNDDKDINVAKYNYAGKVYAADKGFEKGVYVANKKDENKENKYSKNIERFKNLEASAYRFIGDGNMDDSGKAIDEMTSIAQAAHSSGAMNDSDYYQAMIRGGQLNTLRELKAGNIDKAKEYASWAYTPDQRKQLNLE